MASKFFEWFDRQKFDGLHSSVGEMLLAHNAEWHVAHTGGGCLTWELILPGDCWLWITDNDGSSLPASLDDPCLVGFYHDDDSFLSTDTLNLADALNEANEYIAMGRPPEGAAG